MPLETGTFAFGAGVLPLPASTANPLLADADPALSKALAFLSATINAYVGARLISQSALHGLALSSAVGTSATIEPIPYLLNDQFKFPLFCLYRKKDAWDEHTIGFDKSTSTWEFAYVLPPLPPVAERDMVPILRSVAATLRRAIHQGKDPNYNSGEEAWGTVSIERARLVECSYGGYEKIDSNGQYYRALVGTIELLEREMPVTGAFSDWNGTDAALDLHDPSTDTTIADFVDIATEPAPTVTNITPSLGTAAGGTSVTITGTGFLLNSTPTVQIASALCTSVVVVNATTITCKTGAQSTFGTSLISDVTVTNVDGQSGTLPAVFTYTP